MIAAAPEVAAMVRSVPVSWGENVGTREYLMRKIINQPDRFVDEVVEAILWAHPTN